MSSPNPANYKYLPVTSLRFDPDNPRFFGSDEDRNKTQDELYKGLIEEYGALGLIDSLLMNGFMPYEPLVVRPSGGKYIVIEGNRRLAAVKYILANTKALSSQAKSPIKQLSRIPCIIFVEEGKEAKSREQTYLGLRHFSGYKDWNPRSKAEYLIRQLQKGVSPGELAIRLNTTTTRLKKYITAASLLKQMRKSMSETSSQTLGNFWILAEALQRTPIREYILLEIDPQTYTVQRYDKGKFSKLYEFLYGNRGGASEDPENEIEPVISDTRQLTHLATVLSSVKATNILERSKDLQWALRYTDNANEAQAKFRSSCIESARSYAGLKPAVDDKKKLLTILNKVLSK